MWEVAFGTEKEKLIHWVQDLETIFLGNGFIIQA